IYLEITGDIQRGSELVLRSPEILLVHETESFTDATGYRCGNGLLQTELETNESNKQQQSSPPTSSNQIKSTRSYANKTTSKDPLWNLYNSSHNYNSFWNGLANQPNPSESIEQLFGINSTLLTKYLQGQSPTNPKDGFEYKSRSRNLSSSDT
ncbi:hypothetical protein BLOT_008386, partial [Blomia tropicalis]